MRVLVINPNTSRAMTDKIAVAARGAAAPDVAVTAVCPVVGPAAIESHSDEVFAAAAVLAEVADGERSGYDGFVIACFGDPGLDAAREVASGPVVGIAEAAMHLATITGRRFAVVTTLSRTLGRASDLVRRYGFGEACVSMYATSVPVLDLEDTSAESFEIVASMCEQAVADGADSIVLGCAGMSDLCDRLTARVGIPIIDGVAASIGLVGAMVRMGVGTSKRDEYATPPARESESIDAVGVLA